MPMPNTRHDSYYLANLHCMGVGGLDPPPPPPTHFPFLVPVVDWQPSQINDREHACYIKPFLMRNGCGQGVKCVAQNFHAHHSAQFKTLNNPGSTSTHALCACVVTGFHIQWWSPVGRNLPPPPKKIPWMNLDIAVQLYMILYFSHVHVTSINLTSVAISTLPTVTRFTTLTFRVRKLMLHEETQ